MATAVETKLTVLDPRGYPPKVDARGMSPALETLQGEHLFLVDELTIIVAPVILGGGKRLFEEFSRSIELEHLGVRQSPYATFIDYRVKR